MKIANIILEGRYGGPQSRIASVASLLHAQGVQTRVFLPRLDSEYFIKVLEDNKVDHQALALTRLSRQRSVLARFICTFGFEILNLSRALRRYGPDIVHANGSAQFKSVLAARLAGQKVIWHLNDSETPGPVYRIFRSLSSRCDGFICAGERVRRYYLEGLDIDADKVSIIQAPVDTKKFDPQAVQPDARIRARQGVNVVSVGNINPKKGFEYYVEAAALLKETLPQAHFWVIGPWYDSQKAYVQELEALVEREGLTNMTFYGRCTNVAAALAAADVYVCSSTAEASPTVVWEAMAMGRPVVSTDVGDVRAILGDNGFVVPVGDSMMLAERVSTLIKDESLRRRFGEAVRRKAVQELDVARCADRHYAFYTRILQGG